MQGTGDRVAFGMSGFFGTPSEEQAPGQAVGHGLAVAATAGRSSHFQGVRPVENLPRTSRTAPVAPSIFSVKIAPALSSSSTTAG